MTLSGTFDTSLALFRLQSYPLVAVLLLLCLGVLLLFARRPSLLPKAPALIDDDYPVIGALRFWTARWEFFRRAQGQNPSGNFSFFIGKHPVVGVTSDDGRRVFFESKQLGLTEGYSVLFGMFPSARVENKEGEDTYHTSEFALHFKERITRMVRRETIRRSKFTYLPTLISDTRARFDELLSCSKNIIDPFESVYKLVFLLTMRTVGCNELSRDRALLDTTLGLYETVARSANASAILFPWFPSLSVIKRFTAGARLYMILNKIVKQRKTTGSREEDALQEMVDRGDDTSHIVGVIMGALFAAQQNSGINAAWVLVHLANHPDWAAKAREEVQATTRKYFPDDTVPLTERLAMLPLSAWESEFSTIELCLKDSIRLHALGACFRKNISGKDLSLGKNEAVPDESFMTYHMNSIHLDPTVYADPLRWDPARYLPDRAEDKKKPLAYIGWGAGRHPCLGVKFAKLEQNIIAAFFLAMFDFGLSDKKGDTVDSPPPVDLETYSSWKPKDPVFLKLRARESKV